MNKFKVKRGDKVVVIAGKEKGKIGIIDKVIKTTSRVIVSGLNKVFCFNKKEQTGTTTKEMPLHVSNVSHLDPKTNKPTRVRIEKQGDKKVLIAKKSGQIIR